MGDLISREALLKVCRGHARDAETARDFRAADAWRGAEEEVIAAPAVDAVEVVHGRWIINNVVIDNNGRTMPDWPKCSECGMQNDLERNYCPECGAKMDGGERECK